MDPAEAIDFIEPYGVVVYYYSWYGLANVL
jgi:hypothetical protein